MKHAASVRPEPGSNSPLSESYVRRIKTDAFDSLLTLTLLVFCLLESHFVKKLTSIVFVFLCARNKCRRLQLVKIFIFT